MMNNIDRRWNSLVLLLISIILFGCNGESNAQFNEKFIKENKGKYSITVPEVQELVHIGFALTETGLQDHNLVNHDSEYYQEVMEYFGRHKDDKLIKRLDFLLPELYPNVKMDACGFYFNEDGKIVQDLTYPTLNWSDENFIIPLLEELQSFAEKTNFRKFFSAHRALYDKQISLLNIQAPVRKQWEWLEARFPYHYDHYWITFSPLTHGSHSTNRFENNGFKQTVMFISGPMGSNQYSDKVKEGLMTRLLFTEIDHNYINPTSDKYIKEINQSLSKRDFWVKENQYSGLYGNPYLVFNEYMTWALFTLYAYDNFEAHDFEFIIEKTERLMIDHRGYSKFHEFNEVVLRLYKNSGNQNNIKKLYPKILKWCAEFQKNQ